MDAKPTRDRPRRDKPDRPVRDRAPFSRAYSGPAPVRVNKWLAEQGVCSRREADDLIARGLISIDGVAIEEAGRKIEPGQTLSLSSVAEARLRDKLSIVLHKPVGYVSGTPEGDQIPAVRLVTKDRRYGETGRAPGPGARLAPIGRLDQDSRGLLILSEDGVLAKAVIGPDSAVEKEYLVRVRGGVTEAKLERLRHGLALDERELRPAKVTQVADQTLRFILKEGRKRQIRRMCDLVDLRVIDLVRLRVGPVDLADLPEGEWRPLSADERRKLLEAPQPARVPARTRRGKSRGPAQPVKKV